MIYLIDRRKYSFYIQHFWIERKMFEGNILSYVVSKQLHLSQSVINKNFHKAMKMIEKHLSENR